MPTCADSLRGGSSSKACLIPSLPQACSPEREAGFRLKPALKRECPSVAGRCGWLPVLTHDVRDEIAATGVVRWHDPTVPASFKPCRRDYGICCSPPVARILVRRDIAPLANIPFVQCRHGTPELVIQRKHPWLASRWQGHPWPLPPRAVGAKAKVGPGVRDSGDRL